MKWGRIAALAVGGGTLLWILSSVGIGVLARNVAAAGVALPLAIAVHALQLYLSACAWGAALGRPELRRIGLGPIRIWRIRWIREGVNTLMPLAQIVGQVVGVRLLVKAGLTPQLAVGGTILDLTMEAISQLVVTLAAVALLLLLRESDRSWLVWVWGGLGATALTIAGLVAAQRFGLLRWVEAAVERAAAHWPGTANWSMAGLHATLMRRQADRPAMLRALVLHSASWALGGLEVWLLLRGLGHGVGLGPAFVIESLAMAARSAGFVVPGAVGVQEGGFVLVCSLFGIGVETALALSVLKRLRELIIGAAALLAWQLTGDRPLTTSL